MKRLYLRLARYGLPHWPGFLTILLLTAFSVALETLKPWPLQLAVDSAMMGKPLPRAVGWLATLPGAAAPLGLLAWLTSGTIVLFMSGWAVKALQTYIQTDIGLRINYELGADIFLRLQRLSLRFLNRTSTGDLVQRVTGNSACVRELMFSVALPLVTAVLTLIAMVAVMWRIHWTLTLIALGTAPLLFLAIKRTAKPMADRSEEQSNLQGALMGIAERTLGAVPMVQAFGREPAEDERFVEMSRRTGKAYVRASEAQLFFKVSANSVTAIGTSLVMLAAGLLTGSHHLTPGILLVMLSYLAALYQPLETLAYASSGLAYAAGGVKRVSEILDQLEAVTEVEEPLPLTMGAPPRITFENVTFGYDAERPVLKNVSFEIGPGEKVAIVGPTGSGKSTLLALLARLYDPWEGTIRIDGVDIRQYRLSDLRGYLSVVLQEAYLQPGSLRDNIAYGRPDAVAEDVASAAAAAQLGRLLGRMAKGYDTPLGERGATLSGGERQQVAIARALLKSAPVFLLDEPTSSLDALTEAGLVKALDELVKNRTAIIVAHRLSTIRNVDRIIVLRMGEVVESCTHGELRERPEGYRMLWGGQVAAEGMSL